MLRWWVPGKCFLGIGGAYEAGEVDNEEAIAILTLETKFYFLAIQWAGCFF